jgi:hypothetical protein
VKKFAELKEDVSDMRSSLRSIDHDYITECEQKIKQRQALDHDIYAKWISHKLLDAKNKSDLDDSA